MEIIRLKYDAVKKALRTLDIVIKKFTSMHHGSEDYLIVRDSVIQRFEYSIDSFWKFLKIYLEEVQKVSIESSSPRSILKLSLLSGIITEKELNVLMESLSDRNLTSHSYNEEVAEMIQSKVPLYYATMVEIINRIKMITQTSL